MGTIFLLRYQITNNGIAKITQFKKSSSQPDIIVDAYDLNLKLQVELHLTHDYKSHAEKTKKLRNQFLRSSTISTNEHLIVLKKK